MATILEQLLRKPVPEKKKGVDIHLPKATSKEEVEAKPRVAIIDKTEGEEFDRTALKARLQQRRLGISKPAASPSPSLPSLPSLPSSVAEAEEEEADDETDEEKEAVSDDEEEEEEEEETPPAVIKVSKRPKGSVKVKMKVKKKGRIRIGKIHKGTITGIATLKPIPSAKKVKVKKGLKVRVQGKVSKKRSDAPESMIQIGSETIAERLGPPPPSIEIEADAYYMNNREIFINFINGLFQEYRQDLLEESSQISCETKDRVNLNY